MVSITVIVLSTIWSSIIGSKVPFDSSKRVKKITNGDPVPSTTTYNTYYYAQLRHTWACTAEQIEHNEVLTRCQEELLRCGGTLIHPEFVLTAASCVMYYEVVVRYTDVDEIKKLATDPSVDIHELLEQLKGLIVGYVVKPKPKHTIYSDWTLLVGNTDLFKMTQKRHVVNVFPHKVFPQDRSTANLERLFQLTRSSWHDVALLQACLPFDIKKNEVEPAPRLTKVNELQEQYERIVRMGQVCLFLGFGKQEQNRTSDYAEGRPQFIQRSMLHTWRTVKCYSECNFDNLGYREEPHSCHLCSWHHGATLGVADSGDTGGPVACEGKFVATMTRTAFEDYRNHTRTDAYPLHCITNSITEGRLKYYKSVPNGDYHPLIGTRLRQRRFPLPPD